MDVPGTMTTPQLGNSFNMYNDLFGIHIDATMDALRKNGLLPSWQTTHANP